MIVFGVKMSPSSTCMNVYAAFFYYLVFQLNALLVYYIPLHVSSRIVLIFRRVYCIYAACGSLYVTLLR